jgi:hypothetical protein
MGIVDDLADLFSDTLVVQFGNLGATGGFVPSGATASYPCHIEGGVRLVRNQAGKEVVSSFSVIVAGHHNLDPVHYRYTLPSRFSPNANLVAISVIDNSDEDGPCYEEVMFP